MSQGGSLAGSGGPGERSPLRSRKATGAARRRQLIEATITSLAKRGFSDTTMADIAREAQLSHGIINFHFDSKENLLVATLQHMSDEYAAHWRDAVEKAGADPAARLKAMVVADFDPAICTKRKMAAWCAFWGEARSRPTYKDLCSGRDENYQDVLTGLCCAVSGPQSDLDEARSIALALGAMLDGLWLHLMFAVDGHPTREEARDASLAFLRRVFPASFGDVA